MKYLVRKSFIDVIGGIWMPYGATCAQRIDLSAYDIENMTSEDGTITRDGVEYWLALHSGDFSEIKDFSASIEFGDETLNFGWSDEDSECVYNDCMFPCEA